MLDIWELFGAEGANPHTLASASLKLAVGRVILECPDANEQPAEESDERHEQRTYDAEVSVRVGLSGTRTGSTSIALPNIKMETAICMLVFMPCPHRASGSLQRLG